MAGVEAVEGLSRGARWYPSRLPDEVRAFQNAAMSDNTKTAYLSDWKAFQSWCDMHGHKPLPAASDTVAIYIGNLAERRNASGSWRYAPSTIARRVVAIAKIHELAGHTSPTKHPAVTTTMAGIRRSRKQPPRRVAPILLSNLLEMLDHVDVRRFPAGVIGRRDAAILLIGFAGAFRRSELAALTVGDIEWNENDGVHMHLASSKTDQEGRGAIRPLPYGSNPTTCPPCVLRRWLAVLSAGVCDGRPGTMRELRRTRNDGTHICRSPGRVYALDERMPLFRPVHKTGRIGDGAVTGHAINAVVKKRVAAAGMDPSRFSGHSLRAGFVTQATRSGSSPSEIMRQTGHKTPAMVEVYRRENAPLIGNAVTSVGL